MNHEHTVVTANSGAASTNDLQLLSVEEVADRLRIGRTKVYELMGRGALRSVRIGVARRVPIMEVNRFVTDMLTNQEVASPFGESDHGRQ